MHSDLAKLAKLIRYWCLKSTTGAGSGHPSSSLSAADLMTALFFGTSAEALAKVDDGHFRFDIQNPQNPNNDRLVFSKGHASPLFYALWAAAGAIPAEEMLTLRKFGSRLEGHPMPTFPFTEAATGSLGQGLSVGLGMALNAKYLDKLDYRTFVLLGDSEMAEGAVWEAMALAAHYKLDNLIAIVDVNSLGQRGLTMYEHHLEVYEQRAKAFGWETITIDGHNFEEIKRAFDFAQAVKGKPAAVIAETAKGKGVSIMENKDGWHGKPLSAAELEVALKELGEVDLKARGTLAMPKMQSAKSKVQNDNVKFKITEYPKDKPVATRKAYGNALVNIGAVNPNIVVLDAEVSNSTFSEKFKEKFPARFFEMFIAEQNMVGAALGLQRRGKIPFVSTFAAFLTRAFDQIRMAQYSEANIKFCGSHAGVSIGEDGPSQMGLEDIAMFRTILNSVVLYPADAVATEKLVAQMAAHKGISYLRTTRKDTPVIYNSAEEFPIGGCKVLRQSPDDRHTVVAAGITVSEALAAADELAKEGINIRVIDLYSVKPLDIETLKKAAAGTGAIITVEDHFAEGGIGEAVASAIAQIPNSKLQITNLAVRKIPRSGKPEELLNYEEINKNAIVRAIKERIE